MNPRAWFYFGHPGLSKREYIAAMITAAMCSPTSNGCFSDKDASFIVPNAIAMTDYLIAELSKEPKP